MKLKNPKKDAFDHTSFIEVVFLQFGNTFS